MYVPPIYRMPEQDHARVIVERYPLATLLSNGDPAPLATHLPVIRDPAAPGGPDGPLAPGSILLGHMNRANPHWAALADGTAATLIFAGPHSYITPTLYQTHPAAPTWDFVSVHVHGRITLLGSGEETLRVVRATVDAFEPHFGEGWDRESSAGYFAALEAAVGAWRFEITRLDSMFKLSQEKDVEIRRRIITHLRGGDSGVGRDLASLMSELGLERTAP